MRKGKARRNLSKKMQKTASVGTKKKLGLQLLASIDVGCAAVSYSEFMWFKSRSEVRAQIVKCVFVTSGRFFSGFVSESILNHPLDLKKLRRFRLRNGYCLLTLSQCGC